MKSYKELHKKAWEKRVKIDSDLSSDDGMFFCIKNNKKSKISSSKISNFVSFSSSSDSENEGEEDEDEEDEIELLEEEEEGKDKKQLKSKKNIMDTYVSSSDEEDEEEKNTKKNKLVNSNVVELDTLSDPWLDKHKLNKISDEKVVFYDNDPETGKKHQYYLQDANGRYNHLIISGSQLLKYEEWCDDGNNFDLFEASSNSYYYNSNESLESIAVFRSMITNYLNNFKEKRVYTYIERWEKMKMYLPESYQKKNYHYYFRHSVFKLLERITLQFLQDKNSLIELDFKGDENKKNDFIMILRYLIVPIQRFSNLTKIGKYLNELELAKNLDPITLEEFQKIPSEIPRFSGTALHKYLEMYFKNENPKKSILREDEDYDQIKAFVKHLGTLDFEQVKPENSEIRIGSFKHRICGTADLLLLKKNGLHYIIDFKRYLVENKWLKTSTVGDYGITSDFVKFALQLATYRELFQLNGYQMSAIHYIVVFHPLNKDGFKILEIDLTQQLPKPKKKCFYSKYFDDGHIPSSIEAIQAVFKKRNLDLTNYFIANSSSD